ncbi:hypothetical protein ACJBU6_08094 [Exserohilum turcicum]
MASKAFGNGLKELRFLFCQTSEHSAATRYAPFGCTSQRNRRNAIARHGTIKDRADVAARSFLTRSYPAMKKANPSIPIMIREASGTEPTVYARFDFGKEKKLPLKGLEDKAIEQQVSDLVQKGS